MSYLTFFGIDLTSAENKPSACLGLNADSQLVYLGFLARNDDIITVLNFYSPRVIAIDAPLSLPLGLCCLEESCSCEPKSPHKNRECDRELRKLGIPCYPTSKRTFVKKLIYRGIGIKKAIVESITQVGEVIEIYPFATKIRLFGKEMPRKSTKQGISSYKDKLDEALPALRPYSGMFDHNLCDAALAAYTALLYYQNRTIALGNVQEGQIFIPH